MSAGVEFEQIRDELQLSCPGVMFQYGLLLPGLHMQNMSLSLLPEHSPVVELELNKP